MKTYLRHYTSYEGFGGIVESKQLWLKDTMKMNDKKDRIYGEKCVKRALDHCGKSSILRKYVGINISIAAATYKHYSMSFCKYDNDFLWRRYAQNHKGVELIFDVDKLQMAIFEIGGLSALDVLDFRRIYYELQIEEIEKICMELEDRFLKGCPPMHYGSRLSLVKKLLFQICSGYTKSKKWKREIEYRICYIDENSGESEDLISEIIIDLKANRRLNALRKLGIAPEQRSHNKYMLSLGDAFTSDVLPFVYIGKAYADSKDEIVRQLEKNGFGWTKVLAEGDMF